MKATSTITDRMQGLTTADIGRIHDASIQLLQKEGICFNSQKALDVFSKHGFANHNGKVFISEKDVCKALETVPSAFDIHARNENNTVTIGGENFVLLPSGGAPNIATLTGEQWPATMRDFCHCCDLVNTSDQLDMGGWLMVQPNDVPLDTAHLDMLFAYVTRCDKPILGAFGSETMAKDTFEMAGRIFGSKDYLLAHPVTAMIINALTPLQYSESQTEVLMTCARYRQPAVITNMALAGSTAPVRLAGLLALINAEILAGLVLSQIVGPGTPVVYGTTSAPMDMMTSVGVVGAWETVKISTMAIQMAQHYNIPCRTGGALNDAHIPDAQALAEGTLLLSTVIRNGANFILHSCGQLASFMSLSFEKWILDEEVCSLVRPILSPLEVTEETIDLNTILEIGGGGQFLTHPHTFKHFKKLSRSNLFNRNNHKKWSESGAKDSASVASDRVKTRLENCSAPPMDEGLKQELKHFVELRKAEMKNLNKNV